MHGLAEIRALNNRVGGREGVLTLNYATGEIVAYGPFIDSKAAVAFGRAWQKRHGDDPNWNTFVWPENGPELKMGGIYHA